MMRCEVMDQPKFMNYATCGARRRQGDGVCRRPAGAGTNHVGFGRCKLHGGATPNHDLAAARAHLDEIAAHLDLPDPLPHEALQFCVRAVAAQVEYCSRQIATLTPEEAVAGGRLHPGCECAETRSTCSPVSPDTRSALGSTSATRTFSSATALRSRARSRRRSTSRPGRARQEAALPGALRRNLLLESTKENLVGADCAVDQARA